jgi:light-regulated signal transduction histidine kinase (bacteriophytochrome)
MHKIDSNSCEQEPIRFSGAVMPYGVLVVLRSIEVPVIEAVSDNSEALLGLVAEPLLGHGFAEFFGALAQTALLAAAQDPIRPIIPLSLQGRHLQARTSINLTGQLLVDIELAERAAAITGRLGDRYWRQICALRQLTFLPAIARQATQFFRDITGFERVMLYRFDADWNGEVIADAKVDGLPSYLGLNYPASDIPRQARELFQACRLRLIADVDYQPAALVSAGQPHAIDLGQSTLRSVSPMHLDYLRAMGVAATLVGALVVEDRLWGLISCQARTPHALGPAQRVMLEGLCQDIAAVIEVSQIKQKRQEEVRLAARRRQLVATIRANNLSSLMDSVEVADLLDVVGADGFALLDGKYVKAVGDTPASRCRKIPASP